MSAEANQHILQLIQESQFLGAGDKEFLSSKVDSLSPLDKLKLQKNLMNNQAPALLEDLQIMRNNFFQQEVPKKPDLFSKIAQVINPPKPQKVLSHSILYNESYLGSQPPRPFDAPRVQLNTFGDFSSLNQLNSLAPNLLQVNLSDNGDQALREFMDKLDDLLAPIQDINIKRNYFMTFLQSPLYAAYTDTGLTALRHPEIQPASIIFNRLQQIDPKYLNKRQFQSASKISAHLRQLCGV
jgi:hypothetical protein